MGCFFVLSCKMGIALFFFVWGVEPTDGMFFYLEL